jgi:phenylalanyl-tRNA synthetase alpha chain
MKNINEINEKIIINRLKNELNLIENKKDFFSLKNKYLNSNSFLKKYFSILKEINDANQKKEIGKKINKIVEKIKFLLKEKEEFINFENKENKEKFDFTLPIYNLFKKSKENILIYTLEKMINFFSSLGFKIIDDNEIVSSKENFDFLNFPKNHPARNLNDTFFFEKEKKYLLRTHCTTASIKNLSSFLKKNTNFKREINYGLINFGNVFRRDEEDNTHSHQFMQLDGIFASKKTNFSQLK